LVGELKHLILAKLMLFLQLLLLLVSQLLFA
jgi:hypothetical protein